MIHNDFSDYLSGCSFTGPEFKSALLHPPRRESRGEPVSAEVPPGLLSRSPASAPAPGSRRVPAASCAEPGAAPGQTAQEKLGHLPARLRPPRQAGDRDPPWGRYSRQSGATRLPLWDCPFPLVALVVKTLPASAGDRRDLSSIPGLGRSPGGGHGNPLQDSCLGNPTDRGAWWATVRVVAKSLTRLSTQASHFPLERLRPL